MIVNEIMLRDESPSVLSRQQLFCWTKYCVGQFRGDNFRYGAVKPPDPRFRWFPAAVGREAILIASTQSFATPERAVAWLRRQGQVTRRSRQRTSRDQTANDS